MTTTQEHLVQREKFVETLTEIERLTTEITETIKTVKLLKKELERMKERRWEIWSEVFTNEGPEGVKELRTLVQEKGMK